MEKLKQIPQKQLKLILILVTLILVVCSYFFGYQKFSSKAEKLEKENKILINNRIELQQKSMNKDTLIDETNEMKEKIDLMLDEFPAGLTQEKIIMFIYNLANNTGMEISALHLNELELFYPVSGPEVVDTDGLMGHNTKVTISYSSTYEGLKKWVDYIHNYEERMNIPSFSAAFNHTTGKLSGTMIIDLYALSGTNKEFVDPIIEGLPIGTDNIFGAFDSPIDDE
ncbi:MAG: hypothetical protein GX129_03895 [Clostridiales bacterium]|nr:hypothetical protein [Clostridiales bacterium]